MIKIIISILSLFIKNVNNSHFGFDASHDQIHWFHIWVFISEFFQLLLSFRLITQLIDFKL